MGRFQPVFSIAYYIAAGSWGEATNGRIKRALEEQSEDLQEQWRDAIEAREQVENNAPRYGFADNAQVNFADFRSLKMGYTKPLALKIDVDFPLTLKMTSVFGAELCRRKKTHSRRDAVSKTAPDVFRAAFWFYGDRIRARRDTGDEIRKSGGDKPRNAIAAGDWAVCRKGWWLNLNGANSWVDPDKRPDQSSSPRSAVKRGFARTASMAIRRGMDNNARLALFALLTKTNDAVEGYYLMPKNVCENGAQMLRSETKSDWAETASRRSARFSVSEGRVMMS